MKQHNRTERILLTRWIEHRFRKDHRLWNFYRQCSHNHIIRIIWILVLLLPVHTLVCHSVWYTQVEEALALCSECVCYVPVALARPCGGRSRGFRDRKDATARRVVPGWGIEGTRPIWRGGVSASDLEGDPFNGRSSARRTIFWSGRTGCPLHRGRQGRRVSQTAVR